MNRTLIAGFMTLSLFSTATAVGQEVPQPLSDKAASASARTQTNVSDFSKQFVDSPAPLGASSAVRLATNSAFSMKDKFHYYAAETFLNPAVLTAPAFRAGIRMANPPTRGSYTYPDDWRQGLEGFGKNLGDAFAERVSTHTARFLTGVVTREDPRYFPSTQRNVLARSFHAIAFTFVDRSDSGRRIPAVSNFAGAAAGGAVGMAYLPPGFDNVSYAGRRAAINLGALGGANLFREFAPQLPGPVRELFMLIGR